MSGPIFGNANSVSGTSSGNRHLIEFKAGRMNMVGKMLTPDSRKGLVYVYQAEDSLIHFCWKDRTNGKVEDDLIIFPEDCDFKRIDQCKTGRVYLLKFKSLSRRLFFWMQEPNTEKDDEWCRRVNEIMNNPPCGNNIACSRGGEGGELQYMLNNMSQQQLMQLFGGVGQIGGLSSLLGSINRPSDTTTRTNNRSGAVSDVSVSVPSTPAVTANASATSSPTPTTKTSTNKSNDSTEQSSKVLLSELQNYLSEIKTNDGATSIDSGSVDLATAINADAVKIITADAERTQTLIEHLPTIDSNLNANQQLSETIVSPQFQQALSTFSSALQSGQLGPVATQFQLNSEAVTAAEKGDLEQFVKALENFASSNKGDVSKKNEDNDSD